MSVKFKVNDELMNRSIRQMFKGEYDLSANGQYITY